MKILIFGTGTYYQRYKRWFEKTEVVGLLDNDSGKCGVIDGIQVMLPKDGINKTYDKIFILSAFWKEMKEQLKDLGVNAAKIYTWDQINDELDDIKRGKIQVIGCEQKSPEKLAGMWEKGKRILLLSADMTLSGGEIALFNMAVIFKKNGYHVAVCSSSDGLLTEKYVLEEIPVIINPDMDIDMMDDFPWMGLFDVIWINTIRFWHFLTRHSLHAEKILWLHGAAVVYEEIDKYKLSEIDFSDLSVYAVGRLAALPFQKYCGVKVNDYLLYGVPEETGSKKRQQNELVFALVGAITKNKAQDIFVNAIEEIGYDVGGRCKFLIIGRDGNKGYADNVRKKAEELRGIGFSVECTGELDREHLAEMYQSVSVVVCPSIDDTMPTVLVEGMRHQIPCIASDGTGISDYITSGEDGLVCEAGNVHDLAEKMKWMIVNRDSINDMGNRARKLYDKFFSIAVFEKNVLKILNKVISGECR